MHIAWPVESKFHRHLASILNVVFEVICRQLRRITARKHKHSNTEAAVTGNDRLPETFKCVDNRRERAGAN